MKKLILTSLALTTLISCEDFTQKNIDQATPPVNQEANSVDLLLSETSRINSGEFSIEKLIANTGSFVVEPLVGELNQNIGKLSQSINQYCGSLSAFTELSKEQVETLRRPIQESWKDAMATYHKLDMMKFGPVDDGSDTTMDSLYTFDASTRCAVDTQLFLLSLRGPGRLPSMDMINNYNIRGLDTLEPLFFADPNQTRCVRVNPRVAKWFEKPLLEREKTVCTYSKHLLSDIVKKADELAKKWSPQQGHYTATMLRGNAGSPLEVTNAISQALFHVYKSTSDLKLAYPAGFEIRVNGSLTKCPDTSCPKNSEHLYADFGFEAIEASLEGFRHLFFGINPRSGLNGNGFDDLLRSREFDAIADQMKANVDTFLKNLRALKKETTLSEALKNIDRTKCEASTSEDRQEEVCALVWDLRKVTDLLKNEYLSALQEFSAPAQAQGDND